eukprot:gene13954-3464_t
MALGAQKNGKWACARGGLEGLPGRPAGADRLHATRGAGARSGAADAPARCGE